MRKLARSLALIAILASSAACGDDAGAGGATEQKGAGVEVSRSFDLVPVTTPDATDSALVTLPVGPAGAVVRDDGVLVGSTLYDLDGAELATGVVAERAGSYSAGWTLTRADGTVIYVDGVGATVTAPGESAVTVPFASAGDGGQLEAFLAEGGDVFVAFHRDILDTDAGDGAFTPSGSLSVARLDVDARTFTPFATFALDGQATRFAVQGDSLWFAGVDSWAGNFRDIYGGGGEDVNQWMIVGRVDADLELAFVTTVDFDRELADTTISESASQDGALDLGFDDAGDAYLLSRTNWGPVDVGDGVFRFGIVKVTRAGKVAWANRFEADRYAGTATNFATFALQADLLAVGGDGSLAVAITENASAAMQTYLYRFDPSGRPVSRASFGSVVQPTALGFTADGAAVAVGYLGGAASALVVR